MNTVQQIDEDTLQAAYHQRSQEEQQMLTEDRIASIRNQIRGLQDELAELVTIYPRPLFIYEEIVNGQKTFCAYEDQDGLGYIAQGTTIEECTTNARRKLAWHKPRLAAVITE